MADSGEYTPETLLHRQKIADLLLMQAMKPREIRSPLAGVGQLGGAALAGWWGYKDEQEQKAGALAQAQAIAQILQGGPAGGTPTAAPTSAPGPRASDDTAEPTTLVGDNPPIPATAAPPQKLAALPTDNGIVAPPRAPVPSTPRVMGDAEGVKLGLYDQPKVPGAAPPTPAVANVSSALNAAPSEVAGNITWPGADRFNAAYGSRGPAVPTQQVAALAPTAGSPKIDASVLAQPPVPPAAPLPPPAQVIAQAPMPTTGSPDNRAGIAKMLQDPNPYVRKMGIELGKGLVQKQLEGDKPTDEMREYGLDVQQRKAQGLPPQSFFDFKSGLKKAGAQNIQLNNTVNPILKGVGERFNDSMDTAKAAIPQIQGIHEARKALDDGAITGLGADPKLFLAKAANLFGLDEKAAANTEVARSAIGNSVLAKAKTLGANPSNTDRDYIEKVVGGQIGLEESSIRRLLDMQEKWARQSIQRANTEGAKLLKAQPKELESVAPLLNVTEPPSYDEFLKANPRTAAQTAAPTGAPKIRTYNPATGKIE